jgi:dTDP-4-amino-4,6-dideoxygalactose transaminase
LPAGLDPELPIIEDCAWAFGTTSLEHDLGLCGHFVVYSLPKVLPMPFGGLLKSRKPLSRRTNEPLLSEAALRLLRGGVQRHAPRLAEASKIRRANYRRYEEFFAKAGYSPYFDMGQGVVPHAFIFKLDDEVRGKRVKEALRAANIDSSVFFGAGGYYLPNHQNLDAAAISYLHERFLHAWSRAA